MKLLRDIVWAERTFMQAEKSAILWSAALTTNTTSGTCENIFIFIARLTLTSLHTIMDRNIWELGEFSSISEISKSGENADNSLIR